MSKRRKTPAFILEVPLVVKPDDERVLLGRLEAAQRLYNAVLGAALERLEVMRTDPDYAAARALPKKTTGRTEAFAACRKRYGFDDYALLRSQRPGPRARRVHHHAHPQG